MGADLLVTYTKAPRAAAGVTLVQGQVLDVGLARLQAHSFSEFELEDLIEWIEIDLSLDLLPPEPTREGALEVLRERAVAALSSLFPRTGRDPRDVAFLVFDERSYLLTGGLSHGDTPTDSFDDVELIARLGIFNEDITQAELDAL